MSRYYPYQQIADDLRRKISSGHLPEGARLPSERQLVEHYETTRTTVRKAVAILRAEGHIVSRQGAGVFVRHSPGHRYAEQLVEMIEDDDLMLKWALIGAGDVRSEESRRMLVEQKRVELMNLIAAVRQDAQTPAQTPEDLDGRSSGA